MSGVPTSLAVSLMRATKKRSLTTPTTLIVLLLDPQPVLVPLRKVGQRREVAHAIQIDLAVQMVRLVLDHASEELLGLAGDPDAVAVVGLEPDSRVPRNHPAHVRHREAPFPAILHLLGGGRHH